jgi:hypothetical protein
LTPTYLVGELEAGEDLVVDPELELELEPRALLDGDSVLGHLGDALLRVERVHDVRRLAVLEHHAEFGHDHLTLVACVAAVALRGLPQELLLVCVRGGKGRG